MLLKDALKEYHFDCRARKLSEKTIEGYVRMMGYLLDFLQEKRDVAEVEEVRPGHIKQELYCSIRLFFLKCNFGLYFRRDCTSLTFIR